MCGFAGIIDNNGKNYLPIVKNMVDIFNYRGPDDKGSIRVNGASFAHNRLSIIDLSNDANQPMTKYNNRYVLVFNGEIYNYLELKKELEKLNYDFTTKSDTEVLIYAFIEYGEKCLEKLIGMFSGCFYDTLLEKGLLFRDHFGQKPIFCYQDLQNNLYFSSEIKGILKAGIKAEPDFQEIKRYLKKALYDDTNKTFFKNVFQLGPGQTLTIQRGKKYELRRWYDISTKIQNFQSLNFQKKLISLLENVIDIHLRSDVPVGLCLSGGLDSSTLLALLNDKNFNSDQFSCFSVEFEDDFSEKFWVNNVAKSLNKTVHFSTFTKHEFLSSINPMIWHQEAPIGGLMNCAMLKLFQTASNLGTKVLLDGTGLDEIFGGYRNHHNLYIFNEIINDKSKANKLLKEYAKQWDVSIIKANQIINDVNKFSNSAIDGTNPIKLQILDREFLSIEEYSEENIFKTNHDPLTNVFCNYLQKEKIPRNNRMKDRLSMAFGKELRLPFLDWRLAELGLSIPGEKIFEDGLTKSVIRKIMYNKLPDSVRLAQKRSIQAPQGLWLRSEPMKTYINDILNSKSTIHRNIFDIKSFKNLYEEFCFGRMSNSFFVWQLINIEKWFDIFIDNDATKNKYFLQNLV